MQAVAPYQTPVADTSSLQTATSVSQVANDQVSQDAFLRLLVTQLQNQDPLEPQQNSEFVAQLAQFQSLQGQLDANSKLDRLVSVQESSFALSGLAQAAAFVGSEVSWRDPYTNELRTGVVDQISVEQGVTVAHMGDAKIPLEYLVAVRRPTAAPTGGATGGAGSGSTTSPPAPVVNVDGDVANP